MFQGCSRKIVIVWGRIYHINDELMEDNSLLSWVQFVSDSSCTVLGYVLEF